MKGGRDCVTIDSCPKRSDRMSPQVVNVAHTNIVYPCNNLLCLSSGSAHGRQILSLTDCPPSSSIIQYRSSFALPTRDSGMPIRVFAPFMCSGERRICTMNMTRGSFSYFHLLLIRYCSSFLSRILSTGFGSDAGWDSSKINRLRFFLF